MTHHLKNITKAAGLAAWAVVMALSVAACGGGGEDVKPEGPDNPNSDPDVELEVKMENITMQEYEVRNYNTWTMTIDTVRKFLLVMPMHITNHTGSELQDVVIGRGKDGTSSHYCVGSNGQDYSALLTLAASGTDQQQHDLIISLAKNEEKVLSLQVDLGADADNLPSSVDLSLSVSCENYPLKTQYLSVKDIVINRKK